MPRIYVVAAVGSSGAFEWRRTEHEALAALDRIAGPDDDTCIRAINLPPDIPFGQFVTDWLNDHAELWEPRPGERVRRVKSTTEVGPGFRVHEIE